MYRSCRRYLAARPACPRPLMYPRQSPSFRLAGSIQVVWSSAAEAGWSFPGNKTSRPPGACVGMRLRETNRAIHPSVTQVGTLHLPSNQSSVSAYSCPRRAIQSFALSRHLAPATTQLPSPCKRRRATPERTRWHQRAATTATTTTTAASSISGTHGLDRSAFHLISLNLIPLQHRQRRSAIDRAAPP